MPKTIWKTRFQNYCTEKTQAAAHQLDGVDSVWKEKKNFFQLSFSPKSEFIAFEELFDNTLMVEKETYDQYPRNIYLKYFKATEKLCFHFFVNQILSVENNNT